MLDTLRDYVLAHAPNTIRIALIIVLAWLFRRVFLSIIKRAEKLSVERHPETAIDVEKRAQTIGRILRQALAIVVWSVTIMLVLQEFGLDLRPVLAGAGILGLAVGFGAQTLVKDVITGFFILFENDIRIGDTVTAAGASGTVEAINLRTTVLRDQNGTMHIIPNSAIVVVSNSTRDWSRAVVDVRVALKEDSDRCDMVLREVGAELQHDPVYSKKLLGPIEYPGVVKFEGGSFVMRVLVKTQPFEAANVRHELQRRIKKAFDKAGIVIHEGTTT